MSESTLVSVVIPCLNRAQWLVPTIESVLQQDYPHIECIVVDGGSMDGTVEILKRYDDRIKWVSESDDGHADAINKGWRMSKGEILAWLNADDVWVMPDAVSQAVEYLHSHPEVDVVYGDCGAIDAEGALVGMAYLHVWDLEYAVEYCDHCIPQPAAFLRRRVIEKVGWLDTSLLFMDWDLWYRIGLVGTIRHVPCLLAYARSIPSYWHSQGRIAAENCVRITRKFFGLPNVPTNIRAKKRRAISNSYLRGMHYAFARGRHWKTIFSYAVRAVMADLTNFRNARSRLRGHLAAGAGEDVRLQWAWMCLELPSLPGAALRIVKRWAAGPGHGLNLLGDRDVEWSWVSAQMPSGPGEALDFGPGGSHLGLIAAHHGFNVTAVDLQTVQWPYEHPQVRFIMGDILKLPLPEGHFDLVINCSTVEHVGLSGRYGVTENQPDGDLEAMARLRRLLKPGGSMIVTVPVGVDAVFAPLHRVYGLQRLPRLLEGYIVELEEYWVKNDENRWVLTDKQDALSKEPQERLYALGCFVLRRPGV